MYLFSTVYGLLEGHLYFLVLEYKKHILTFYQYEKNVYVYVYLIVLELQEPRSTEKLRTKKSSYVYLFVHEYKF